MNSFGLGQGPLVSWRDVSGHHARFGRLRGIPESADGVLPSREGFCLCCVLIDPWARGTTCCKSTYTFLVYGAVVQINPRVRIAVNGVQLSA
jgi:hypothetical protein